MKNKINDQNKHLYESASKKYPVPPEKIYSPCADKGHCAHQNKEYDQTGAAHEIIYRNDEVRIEDLIQITVYASSSAFENIAAAADEFVKQALAAGGTVNVIKRHPPVSEK
jgi:hypothetical protein